MDPANFLFCSLDAALIADIAWQVHREGHDVRYYIEAENDREIGDGFVPKTDDWRGELEWADVVVFDDIWIGDDVGTGELAAELPRPVKLPAAATRPTAVYFYAPTERSADVRSPQTDPPPNAGRWIARRRFRRV